MLRLDLACATGGAVVEEGLTGRVLLLVMGRGSRARTGVLVRGCPGASFEKGFFVVELLVLVSGRGHLLWMHEMWLSARSLSQANIVALVHLQVGLCLVFDALAQLALKLLNIVEPMLLIIPSSKILTIVDWQFISIFFIILFLNLSFAFTSQLIILSARDPGLLVPFALQIARKLPIDR